MPAFLQKWQHLLRSMDGRGDAGVVSTNTIDYCQELVALARSWKLIGDIIQARSTLGKCCEVTRRHLKTPFAKSMPFENGEHQKLRHVAIAAKELLLECVAFQISLARNKELFRRHDAPSNVQAALTKDFWMLFRQAPISVEIAFLLSHSLMKQRQFTLVIRFLEQAHLADENAELTLIHVRALEYVGFYRQAIDMAEQFIDQRYNDNVTSIEAVEVHCNRMTKLLACREKADEFLRLEQYEKAVNHYQECLALVDSTDRKQFAALLYGHANALLGLEQISTAIDDLRKSVQLDPTNKIASIRLQTACLQLETERIKKKLSRKRGPKFPITSSTS
ncbi:Trimethylguanosine synthase [Phytophthora megakarya]|uniref:Trimethylguanosine synthase n=1 Tax=Phytophthora megakarya TaxID=4795 RepID=A0A225VE44_9STRA|nr:Trimethylguanosine synthase [Phytophthora megakarya]